MVCIVTKDFLKNNVISLRNGVKMAAPLKAKTVGLKQSYRYNKTELLRQKLRCRQRPQAIYLKS